MTPAARLEAAIFLIDKITAERRAADDIVRAWFQTRRYVGSKDRRAIRERVYGVLRRINRLDWHISQAGGGHEGSARERVLADIVLEGQDPAELFTCERHAPAPLGGDEQALADALQGRTLDDPAQPAHVRAELPQWLADKLQPLYGERFQDEMAALNEPAPMDLRVALSRVSREQALKALHKAGIEATPTAQSPLGLRIEAHGDIGRTDTFRKGLIEVQDEGSQLLSLLVGAKADMAVLDYCAGAGGKTLAIADRMGLTDGHSSGSLTACDIDAARLARMDRRLQRAKLADKIQRVGVDEAQSLGPFDRVLADAPCSGSGTWRRHPEQKKRLTPERLEELTRAQDEVLDGAAKLVRTGGRLIYATCSLLREENEDRVAAFLERHPDFAAVPIQDVWAEALKTVPCPAMDGPYLRLTPAQHGTDGFFVAVLERTAKLARLRSAVAEGDAAIARGEDVTVISNDDELDALLDDL